MAGNDDMNNGNGSDVNRIYTDALTAQLGERVTNLNRRQSDLESEMRSGFKQIESSMTALSSEMRSSVAALSANLAERSRPQWQALGVALTFAAMLGGLAYLPVREATSDLKTSVAMLAERMVTQKEMEWRTARGAEDRQRSEAMIKELREEQVPRKELDRVFNSYDEQRADIQRQLDEVKQAQGSVYGARDILLDLRERIDRMERQRLSGVGN
jgi:DNA repair exonuclease SbcCD ATPase subunit